MTHVRVGASFGALIILASQMLACKSTAVTETKFDSLASQPAMEPRDQCFEVSGQEGRDDFWLINTKRICVRSEARPEARYHFFSFHADGRILDTYQTNLVQKLPDCASCFLFQGRDRQLLLQADAARPEAPSHLVMSFASGELRRFHLVSAPVAIGSAP